MVIASYDIDGVIYQGPRVPGLFPRRGDVIITGRSFEEMPETKRMLESKGIFNEVWFNPVSFDEKTRVSSGRHKVKALQALKDRGMDIAVHYEDDPVQGKEIANGCPWIEVVMVISDLVEKENVRHEFP